MDKVHERNTALRCSCLESVQHRFELFVAALNQSFGTSLDAPQFRSLYDIKKFSSGLLEGQKDHPWTSGIRRLSVRSRFSIGHSLFLFRKVIPSEKPAVKAYVERMITRQDPADRGFVEFCRREVRAMFYTGWDKRYLDKCTSSTLPLSACYETRRRNGGSRGLSVEDRWERDEYVRYVTESTDPIDRGASRVQAVETGGKWRVISIPPRNDNALRPFHQCLYDFVSSQEWCLRGDAVPRRFKGFHKNGEIFVSGDYESATDNLNSEVQYAILEELIGKARSIPSGIALHALSTFKSRLEGGGVSGEQQRGQLMGQLLSFPLLCLTNYLTFKYSIPRDVPVKINGDDIVFRATEEEVDRWEKNVSLSGLKLSVGKTLKHRHVFSLNSCMFDAGVNDVRFVPFIRPKALWGDKESMPEKIASLKSRFYASTVGMGQERSLPTRRLFLRTNHSAVMRCRRSLTRGMGIKVTEGDLRDVGLWHRELYYLEKDVEPPIPFWSFAEIKANNLPTGWRRVSPRWYPEQVLRGWQFRLSHETVKLAWSQPVITDSLAKERWLAECDQGVSPWGLKGFMSDRIVKLMRMSRKAIWKWCCLRTNSCYFGRVNFTKGRSVLIPDTLAT